MGGRGESLLIFDSSLEAAAAASVEDENRRRHHYPSIPSWLRSGQWRRGREFIYWDGFFFKKGDCARFAGGKGYYLYDILDSFVSFFFRALNGKFIVVELLKIPGFTQNGVQIPHLLMYVVGRARCSSMSAPCNILILNLCETNKGEGPSPTYLLLRRGCLSLPKSSFKKNVYFFPIFFPFL